MIDLDSYIMEIDEDGPHIDCSLCDERIQNGEKCFVVGDLRFDSVCIGEIISKLNELVFIK